jgi:hypothetical protein
MKLKKITRMTAAGLLFSVLLPVTLIAQNNIPAVSHEAFKFSFLERFRIETWDNAVTLSKDAKAGTSYTRIRTSLMGQWYPNEMMEVDLKLSHEFRRYFSPSTAPFHMNEIFIDQLFLKLKTDGLLNGNFTLGRQNINLGEGFLVLEGNPLDGSRSIYFNAARFDWKADAASTATFFWTYQTKTDKLFVLNGNDIDPSSQGKGTYNLIEQDETGGGVYYEGKFTSADIQSYFIRKDYIHPDALLNQVKSGVNTIGGRTSVPINTNLSATLEGAYQFGKKGDYKQKSYGGYCYVDYNSLWQKSYLPKTITAGAIYLSGDDPTTKDNEGWDPIFSRWPKWSESYIYTQVKEFGGKVGYWSNLASVYSSILFGIAPYVNFSITYHHLMAPKSGMSSSFVSGKGKTRGELVIGKLLFDISENVSGHLWWEHFIPGSYYFDGANSSDWARVEFILKY